MSHPTHSEGPHPSQRSLGHTVGAPSKGIDEATPLDQTDRNREENAEREEERQPVEKDLPVTEREGPEHCEKRLEAHHAENDPDSGARSIETPRDRQTFPLQSTSDDARVESEEEMRNDSNRRPRNMEPLERELNRARGDENRLPGETEQ